MSHNWKSDSSQRNAPRRSDPQQQNSHAPRAGQAARVQNDCNRYFREGSVVSTSDFGFQAKRVYTNDAAENHAEQQQVQETPLDCTNTSSECDEFPLYQTASMFGTMRKKRFPMIPKPDPTAPKSRFALSEEDAAQLPPKDSAAQGKKKNKKWNRGPRGANHSNQWSSSKPNSHGLGIFGANSGTSSGAQTDSRNAFTEKELEFFSAIPSMSAETYHQLRNLKLGPEESEENTAKKQPLLKDKKFYDMIAELIADTDSFDSLKAREPVIYAKLVKIIKRGCDE